MWCPVWYPFDRHLLLLTPRIHSNPSRSSRQLRMAIFFGICHTRASMVDRHHWGMCMYAQPAAELRPHPAHCLLSQSSLAMLRASTWSYLLPTCLAKTEHVHYFSRGTIAYKYILPFFFFSYSAWVTALKNPPPFIKAAWVRSRMDAWSGAWQISIRIRYF